MGTTAKVEAQKLPLNDEIAGLSQAYKPANQNEPGSSASHTVSPRQFFETLFGNDRVVGGKIHVASFSNYGHPAWGGRSYEIGVTLFDELDNNYVSIAPKSDASKGRSGSNIEAHILIVADDVGTKVNPETVREKMGTPTFRIRTSSGNETWGWKLDQEVASDDELRMQQLAAIRDNMKNNGLTDPGSADGPRYIRLHVGSNTKPEYQSPIDGRFPSCALLEWNPSARVDLVGIGNKLFGPDFVERAASGDYASMAQVETANASAKLNDPWAKLADAIGMNPRKGSGEGKIDADCPNMDAHVISVGREHTGFALLGGGSMKCHHGECAHLTVGDMQGTMYRRYEQQVEDRRHAGTLAEDVTGGLRDIFTGDYVPATGAAFIARETFNGAVIEPIQLANMLKPAQAAPSNTFIPRPFQLATSTAIPPRQWLYGQMLIRGHASLLVSPGGLGKSSLVIVEAIAMSAGKSLLGDKPIAPLRVFVWNGEDPSDELVRRTTAACQHHGVTAPEIDGNLFLVSGRDLPIKIIRGERHGVTVAQPAIDWIVKLLRENKVDVLVIDPFVTTHDAPENDNTAMNAAVSAWREVADRANCSILLVHHVSKAAALDGDSQGIYGSRGGGALIDGVRNARVLVRMTKDEASRFGIQEKDRWQYFRVQNGKSNLAPSAEAVWRRMVGVPLHNGSGNWPDGDVVGVAEEWVPAKSTSILPAGSLSRVQDAIVQATDAPRADERAEHWVGYLVADVLHMDIGVPGGRKSQRTDEQNLGRAQIRQWVVAWLAEGFLIQVDGRREKGGPTTMIAVGIKEPDAPRTDQPPAA